MISELCSGAFYTNTEITIGVSRRNPTGCLDCCAYQRTLFHRPHPAVKGIGESHERKALVQMARKKF